ncbi:MAG: hypothetical protein N4A46_14200 [Schleiferiaceae bacterium]|jgi:hypothetical protein|nr:hypothetical protein [Schleiferiaceae bacterium]
MDVDHLDDDAVIKAKAEARRKTRKRLVRSIWILVILNMILVTIVEPLIPAFYGMNGGYQALYIFSMYGVPIWIILPIALFSLILSPVVSKRYATFKQRFSAVFRILFLTANSLWFFSLVVLTLSSISGESPFKKQRYDELISESGSVKDLKTGTFYDDYGTFIRTENEQLNIPNSTQDTIRYNLSWNSSTEYVLDAQEEQPGGMNKLVVKITENTEEYYVCWVKMGEYAQEYKIYKAK